LALASLENLVVTKAQKATGMLEQNEKPWISSADVTKRGIYTLDYGILLSHLGCFVDRCHTLINIEFLESLKVKAPNFNMFLHPLRPPHTSCTEQKKFGTTC
jgi:hypothetical protein